MEVVIKIEVKDNNVEQALRVLKRKLQRDGFFKIIKLKNKDHWFDVFEKADCCCSIVKSLEEAINDNHFKVREIFSRKILSEEGHEIPALPIPIDNQFRKAKIEEKAPKLGVHNDLFF